MLWKCHVQNVCHFVQASIYKLKITYLIVHIRNRHEYLITINYCCWISDTQLVDGNKDYYLYDINHSWWLPDPSAILMVYFCMWLYGVNISCGFEVKYQPYQKYNGMDIHEYCKRKIGSRDISYQLGSVFVHNVHTILSFVTTCGIIDITHSPLEICMKFYISNFQANFHQAFTWASVTLSSGDPAIFIWGQFHKIHPSHQSQHIHGFIKKKSDMKPGL